MFELIPLNPGAVTINIIGFSFTIGTVVIDPAETKQVEAVPVTTPSGIIWYLTINYSDGVTTYQELSVVSAVLKGDGTAEHNHYGILGDQIDYDLIVVYEDGQMKLSITNNEAFTMTVKFSRVVI